MKVEIWSDFTCPFCYIAKKHFDIALEGFEQRQFVEVEYKSFQLDKGVIIKSCESIYNVLYKNYELPYNRVEEMMHHIQKEAAQIGLSLSLENLLYANTWNAHKLVKYAEKHGKALASIDLLFRHYFLLRENISEVSVLLGIAEQLSFDRLEIEQLFSAAKYDKAIHQDSDLAEELGIYSVPFFIINEKYALSGAQTSDYLLAALEQIWDEDKADILAKRKKGKQATECCEGPVCPPL